MPSTKAADQELVDLYNEIDHWLRKQTGQDKFAEHSYLIQQLAASNHVVARYQQILRAVAQIRNSLVHNPLPNVAQPLIQPNPALVNVYREVRDALVNPAKALSLAIPAQRIYTTTYDFKLHKLLKDMDDNIFTHVPVIEDNKMVGIFSENTLLSYFAESGEALVTKDMTVGDLKTFLPLEAHHGESFAFLPRRASANDVYAVFNKAIQAHKRIGMIFVTEHGRHEEKPLGIITAWDLASPDLGL